MRRTIGVALLSLALSAAWSCESQQRSSARHEASATEASPRGSWTVRHPPLAAYDADVTPNAQHAKPDTPLSSWAVKAYAHKVMWDQDVREHVNQNVDIRPQDASKENAERLLKGVQDRPSNTTLKPPSGAGTSKRNLQHSAPLAA